MIENIPVISIDDMKNQYEPSETILYMGIGYKKAGLIREKFFNTLRAAGYHFASYIHPTAVIFDKKKIGEGNIILENVVIEARCSIGNANLFFAGVIIGHDNEIGNFNTFSINACTAGAVHVGNRAFFGVGSSVRDSVDISDAAFVGAGSYVDRSLPESVVYVPSRSYILEGRNSIDIW